MTASTPKPRLIFIPHYIGSLRYFEKIKPFLEHTYDISFLLLPLNQGKYQAEMIRYANEHNLPIQTITQQPPTFLTRHLPFYETLGQARIYKREIRQLFTHPNIKKIIAVNDCGFPLHYLLKEARATNIDTMVLQWAVVAPGQQAGPQYVSPNILRRWAFRGAKPLYEYTKKKLLECTMGTKLEVAKKTIGSGSANRFGVINMQTRDYLAGRGVPVHKMSVVGYLDFFLAEQMKKDLAQKSGFREQLARQHQFDITKKNVIVYSSPYNTKDVTFLSDAEQCDYIESIFNGLQSVLPNNQYDFHLKIHPAEDRNVYAALASRGVRIYGKEANNFELIGLSDLYIADSTTTNFIPILMDTDSIFVNFLKLDMVEMAKSSYGITSFISTVEEFKQMVSRWKNGALEKQFVRDDYLYTTDSLEKIRAWIN
jgi:hypothetical protein